MVKVNMEIKLLECLMSTEIDLCTSICGHKENFGALQLNYCIIGSAANGQFFTS